MFEIRQYIPLAIITCLSIIAATIISASGLDRIEQKLITLEPKDETSTQCTVEEKNSTPVSSFFGLTTRMAYYVTYTNDDQTKTALVDENTYRKITDVIYLTPTTSPNPLLIALHLIAGSAALAIAILAAKDLNIGKAIRSLIRIKR